MPTDFERRKRNVLASVQKNIGFRAPPKVKEAIDQMAGAVYDERDLEEYRVTAKRLMELAKLAMTLSYLPSPKTPKNPPTSRYQRPFRKRLHLVEFIIAHRLTERKRRQSASIRRRINWKNTCAAWNESHPYDPMTPEVLKATFYRAIADEDVQRGFSEEMGDTIPKALWVGRLYGLPASEELVMAWANVFTLWEAVSAMTDAPFNDRERELEREMISNPYAVHELGREVAILALARSRGFDPDELKDLSNKELRELVESGKYRRIHPFFEEAQDEK